jgi:hypothetical protein
MRRLLLGAAALCSAAVLVSVHTASIAAQGSSQVQNGNDISPVPLNLKGLNPAKVRNGSYIVNTSGCNDCHTNPPYAEGGDPFLGQPEQINVAGFLGGGTPFGPPPPAPPFVVSRNLTPNAAGRPANLTLDEFKETLRTGRDLKNRHPEISPLLQVMPWPVYGKLSDKDLEAVYEYLRAIPCVGSAARCGP